MEVYSGKLDLELDKLRTFTEVLLKLSKVNSNRIEYKFVEDIVNSLNKEIDIEYILATANGNSQRE